MDRRCMRCGAEIAPESQFCMNCGAPVYPIVPDPVQEQSVSSVVPDQVPEEASPDLEPTVNMGQFLPIPNPCAPAIDPNQPAMEPYTPVVDPNQPVMAPYTPVVDPNQPVMAPYTPVMDPNQPVMTPYTPVMDPNQPVMNQYPPIPNQNTPVMDPNQSAMNQYPMQGTMPTKTKKPKNPEVMTRAANAGLAVVLSLSLLFTTLTVFVSFRKDISSNSFMARVVEVVDDGIVWVILSAVLLVGFLALCIWMNVKRKKEIVLVVSIACLCAGSLFLQLQGINAMIVAVSEMIMGAILLLVYSFLSREKKMTDNEDIKETAVA